MTKLVISIRAELDGGQLVALIELLKRSGNQVEIVQNERDFLEEGQEMTLFVQLTEGKSDALYLGTEPDNLETYLIVHCPPRSQE